MLSVPYRDADDTDKLSVEVGAEEDKDILLPLPVVQGSVV